MLQRLGQYLLVALVGLVILFFFILFLVAFPLFYFTTRCPLCITATRLTIAAIRNRFFLDNTGHLRWQAIE